MTTDINKLPPLVLPGTEGAPNPFFADQLQPDGTWKPFVQGDPKYPWRNFHEVSIRNSVHRYFIGYLPGIGHGLFRVKR